MLGCDYFSAYRKYARLNENVLLQFCLAHFIRDVNNLAEQVLRFVAIHRRLTQGTRGLAGQRWWERICTVVATCGQQGRSVFLFLREVVTQFFADEPTPSLAPGGT